MKLTPPILPIVAAAVLTLGACQPTVVDTQHRVKNLITAVEPAPADLAAAEAYYDSRTDLKITPEERDGLIHSLAKMYSLKRGLEEGTITLTYFIRDIIGSDTHIITTPRVTKLRISTNTGASLVNHIFEEGDLRLVTDPYSQDRLLIKPIITEVRIDGGTMTVRFAGNEHEILGNKHEVPFGKDQLGPSSSGSYEFSLRLVLDEPDSSVIADGNPISPEIQE